MVNYQIYLKLKILNKLFNTRLLVNRKCTKFLLKYIIFIYRSNTNVAMLIFLVPKIFFRRCSSLLSPRKDIIFLNPLVTNYIAKWVKFMAKWFIICAVELVPLFYFLATTDNLSNNRDYSVIFLKLRFFTFE